jgi:hypothetical protein
MKFSITLEGKKRGREVLNRRMCLILTLKKWVVCSGRDTSGSISGTVKLRYQLRDYQLLSEDYC